MPDHSILNRVVRVAKRADGIPTPDCFTVSDEKGGRAPPGGVLVKVIYASVDPGMRGALSRENNYSRVLDGAVMPAMGVGEIIQSSVDSWECGQLVYGSLGWQRYAAVTADQLFWPIVPDLAPPEAWLGTLGINGLTAWLGLHQVARPKAGETVLVSTASGGVGGVVGQLGAAARLRMVGLTGSPAKVALAEDELGYDHAIDYRQADNLEAEIGRACPEGIDVFFDNTGGTIADSIFEHLNVGARIVQCGTAAIASWLPKPQGPRRERDMLVKRLSWHGFLVHDFVNLFPQALAELKQLYVGGALTSRSTILDGIDQAPGAIAKLYAGEDVGRLLIRI